MHYHPPHHETDHLQYLGTCFTSRAICVLYTRPSAAPCCSSSIVSSSSGIYHLQTLHSVHVSLCVPVEWTGVLRKLEQQSCRLFNLSRTCACWPNPCTLQINDAKLAESNKSLDMLTTCTYNRHELNQGPYCSDMGTARLLDSLASKASVAN